MKIVIHSFQEGLIVLIVFTFGHLRQYWVKMFSNDSDGCMNSRLNVFKWIALVNFVLSFIHQQMVYKWIPRTGAVDHWTGQSNWIDSQLLKRFQLIILYGLRHSLLNQYLNKQNVRTKSWFEHPELTIMAIMVVHLTSWALQPSNSYFYIFHHSR